MTTVSHGGITYGLGARQRPTDPRELRYRLVVPPTVDFTKPRSLAKWRSRVEDQGQMGSCVAHAVTSAAELLAASQGRTVEQLDRLWLYARSRQKDGTFPEDAGTYPATALDIGLTGLPKESLEPDGYVADPTINPGAAIDADAPHQDYILSHRAFYATDPGGFMAGLVTALDQGLPVVVALGWRNEFFTPTRGVLPVKPNTQIVGGHAIHAWGFVPAGSGHGDLVACRNSWGTTWTGPDVAQVFADAEPGDFFIPRELFENGIVWECRAVSPEAVPVPPNPPTPPTPPADDKADRIMNAVRGKLVELQQASAKQPHATLLKWRARGGGLVRDAAEVEYAR